jgi:hypothetical protein
MVKTSRPIARLHRQLGEMTAVSSDSSRRLRASLNDPAEARLRDPSHDRTVKDEIGLTALAALQVARRVAAKARGKGVLRPTLRDRHRPTMDKPFAQ